MREPQAASGYPVIDPDRCGADNDCVDLCETGVIEVGPERLEPVIAHPERCVDGCTLCVDICSKDAIQKVTNRG
jgi:NAD-dependent dihydropyrimidine dehydrogenase PreA subunit